MVALSIDENTPARVFRICFPAMSEGLDGRRQDSEDFPVKAYRKRSGMS